MIEFFEGIDIQQVDITLDIGNGKNTGFAVVELHSEGDKVRALELNKKSMGARWIGITQAEVMRKNNNNK